MMLESLTRDAFARLVPSTWRVVGRDGGELTLVEASEVTVTGPWETYSVCFLGPAADLLEQGIHRLAHHELGELDLFLVPIGKDGDTVRYESVFSRAVHSTSVAGG